MTASLPAGTAQLAQRYALDEQATSRLAMLLALLVEDPLAPTALRDPARVVEDHLADSLVALELEAIRTAAAVVDIGSGAGLPGLPLAIALPEAAFVLMESARRKCAFIERAVELCSLRNVRVVHSRAESWIEGLRSFDAALARALAPSEVVLEYAAPLLKLNGTAVLWRGQRDPAAEAVTERAADELGLRLAEVRRVRPYPAARNRHLHLFLKVRQTPDRFPRRPGMALKRPLGRG